MIWKCHEDVSFTELLGKTLVAAKMGDDKDEIRFVTEDGTRYVQYHSQNCCESVAVESIVGDLSDLIGSPILLAEEVTHNGETPDDVTPPEYSDSYTWTFYKSPQSKAVSRSVGWVRAMATTRKASKCDVSPPSPKSTADKPLGG